MKALWQRYAARFDALTVRERIMVFAAVVVAVIAVGYTGLIEPQLAKQKRLSSALLQKHSELKSFEVQAAQLFGARAPGAAGAGRDRLAELRAELAALDARIAAEGRRFTSPSQMRAVIRGLLERNRSVALVEMRTLPVDSLVSGGKPGPKPTPGERFIYRHGLELTVTGAYLDLLAYARDLEKLPQQLYWSALELDAAGYPKVSMKLVVYTLSLDPTWLSV